MTSSTNVINVLENLNGYQIIIDTQNCTVKNEKKS